MTVDFQGSTNRRAGRAGLSTSWTAELVSETPALAGPCVQAKWRAAPSAPGISGATRHRTGGPLVRSFDPLNGWAGAARESLPRVVAYFFLAGACFAAMASRLCCMVVAALLCFCVACLFVAFGDLSPMMFYLSFDGLLKEIVKMKSGYRRFIITE